MTTTHVRRDTNGAAETRAATEVRDRQAHLRDWIESLGPAAVVTFVTHDDYEREQRRLHDRPTAPPALGAPGR